MTTKKSNSKKTTSKKTTTKSNTAKKTTTKNTTNTTKKNKPTFTDNEKFELQSELVKLTISYRNPIPKSIHGIFNTPTSLQNIMVIPTVTDNKAYVSITKDRQNSVITYMTPKGNKNKNIQLDIEKFIKSVL